MTSTSYCLSPLPHSFANLPTPRWDHGYELSPYRPESSMLFDPYSSFQYQAHDREDDDEPLPMYDSCLRKKYGRPSNGMWTEYARRRDCPQEIVDSTDSVASNEPSKSHSSRPPSPTPTRQNTYSRQPLSRKSNTTHNTDLPRSSPSSPSSSACHTPSPHSDGYYTATYAPSSPSSRHVSISC